MCPICIKPIETRRLMRNDTKITEISKFFELFCLVDVMQTDLAFFTMNDDAEQEDLSKSIIREQELMNEIRMRQVNDKNSKKKGNKSAKKKGSKLLLKLILNRVQSC
jgi:hypothetical protein